MLQYPDLSGFSEEERTQLMTIMKKAQVNFVIIGLLCCAEDALSSSEFLDAG